MGLNLPHIRGSKLPKSLQDFEFAFGGVLVRALKIILLGSN